MKNVMSRSMVLVVGLSLMGAGCNPFESMQKRVEQRIGEEIGEKIVEGMAGGDADVEIGGTELQANFPSDVPRYPNAVYVASVVQKEGEIAIANFRTQDSGDEVASWFATELTRDGFVLDTDIAIGALARIYKKGDVTITLQVQSGGETNKETVVSIQRIQKK